MRKYAANLWRWLRDPRLALVVGALLMAGSAIAAAMTWPPSQTTIRPFIVGALLILRGLLQPLLRRGRQRRRHPRARESAQSGAP